MLKPGCAGGMIIVRRSVRCCGNNRKVHSWDNMPINVAELLGMAMSTYILVAVRGDYSVRDNECVLLGVDNESSVR